MRRFTGARPCAALTVAVSWVVVVALAAPTAEGAEKLKGNVVANRPDQRELVVKLTGRRGKEATFKVRDRCPVKFSDGAEYYPNPTVRDVVPPMYIWFSNEDGVITEIDVREIPNELRRPHTGAEAGRRNGRITAIVDRQYKMMIQTAEGSDTYVVDPGMLSRVRVGDQVEFLYEVRDGRKVILELEKQ